MDYTLDESIEGLGSGRCETSGPAVPRGFEAVKRLLDVVLAAVGVVASLPILLGCGLWIKLVDGGPVIYSQWRVGRDGWLFRLYKLRTMTTDAECDGRARFASEGDPRIIAGCAWMRKSHADELPQLWNILRGQMSLVGPRPERPEMIEWLRASIQGIDARLRGKPGLTGLAQVSNGYTNDLDGARRKLEYDIDYLRRRSLRGDLRLLIATFPKLWDHTAI